ncbi:component of the polarisome [Exophiala xenobiotica]|nr:component of the polarisome [Exophiala xenobiotica]KAK5227670.1 component of the polarisome [Exophiala xenobiotica]KAK5246494.1 component of the polarisome [Exophiala xenobiotica]KAK5325849.1 component of the polarisome [Exophiala xenobiotica]KAK5347164.1 component of the polarisome [Exophiala xenobiotica]
MPPPPRGPELSPTSTTGSDGWSGLNSYNQIPRNDGPYTAFNPSGDDYPAKAAPFPRPGPNSANFAPGSLDPLGQRRPSESGSRGSSRTGSVAASRSSDGTLADDQSRKYRRMEAQLFQHYTILKGYLKGGAQAPPRPNKARDKLLRLSPVQFHELSTDVFDELQRRQAGSPLPGRPPRQQNVPPFLQPRPDFHEKRNQARQKLSSLQAPRFKDLSTDVFCELERRFPQFTRSDGARRESSRSHERGPGSVASSNGGVGFGLPPRAQTFGPGPGVGYSQRQESAANIPQFDNPPPSNDYGRPMAKQFQSNTITPNKSMMVEDEDDMQATDSKYDRSSDAFGLESSLTSPRSDRDTSATSQSGISYNSKPSLPAITELQDKLADLEATLDVKEAEVRDSTAEAEKWKMTTEALEKKLQAAEDLNKSLKEEIERLKVEQPSYSGESVLWKTKYLKLDQDHGALQDRLAQQQELTDEVRRQGQDFLEEMRAMAEEGGNPDREQKLQADVTSLEEEVKEWKARYVRAKTQLRSVRASSLGLSIARPDANRHAAALQDRDGLVKDVHVTKFQISIDELLRIARSDNPAAVLDHMKTVVLAVRGITSDVDAASTDKNDEIAKRRAKLKSKVSATANNLITASKNFASASGLSPVSLVDAAASHLTAAVVDLLHTVKIRPTPQGELGDDDDGALEPLQSNGYFNIAETLRRRSAVESVYSALSTPPETRNVSMQAGRPRSGSKYLNGTGLGIQSTYGPSQEEADLEDLKMYLEDQTDGLVHSITSLVGAIRNDEAMPTIQNHISTIAGTIENVVTSVERTSSEPSSYQAMLVEKSQPVVSILQDCREKLLQASTVGYDGSQPSKEFTQKLPPLAFQVARETKELVSRIMAIEVGRGEEDFS